MDQLVDRVWGEQLPQRGRDVVYGYLSRLRAVLPDVPIERRHGGYQLTVPEAAVDLHEFRALVKQARAAGTAADALARFDQALALWRDTPFAGLDTAWLQATRADLEAEHQAARRDRTDTALRAGQHADLLPDLTVDAEREPLDERLAAQLMLALHQSGRPSDALRHFEKIKARLADELGTDPGPALREVHHRILTDDHPEPSEPDESPDPTPVPRQLPATPTWFTGRVDELAELDKTDGSTVVISALAGAGGMGKTWLALHWAHHNQHRFPDGQLFVDLRGFSPTGEPMGPAVALRGFLTALGVQPDRLPTDQHAQEALYRSLLADKRMLVVLDNAAEAAQVTPLLPGGATCTVLVTSRRHLTGLLTRRGAHLVRVGILTESAARDLLVTRLGAERVANEPEATAELLAACAGFPLALGIVAANATVNPDVPLARLAADLRDSATRLHALDDEDPEASLPAVLSWSYQALTPAQLTLFALLGIAPGPDISEATAAALAGTSLADTQQHLHALERLSLIDRTEAGRYRLHDLIRLHARDQATRLSAANGQQSAASDQRPTADGQLLAADPEVALRRLLEFYLHSALDTRRLLTPHGTPLELEPPASGCQPLRFTDESAALAWLDIEYPNLLAALQTAQALRWPWMVAHLAWALHSYYTLRALLHDAIATWRAGLAAADELGDLTIRIVARRCLGDVVARVEPAEAVEYMAQALVLATEAGDSFQLVHVNRALSLTWLYLGDPHRALGYATEMLRAAQDMRDPVWTADAYNTVGWCAALTGDYDRARDNCETALTLLRDLGLDVSVASTLDSLGYIYHQTGRHEDSIAHYQQAVDLIKVQDNAYEIPGTLERMGHPYVALGQPAKARAVWQEALALFTSQHREEEAAQVQQNLDSLAE